MQVDPLVAKLDRRYQDLSNSRSNWEKHWHVAVAKRLGTQVPVDQHERTVG